MAIPDTDQRSHSAGSPAVDESTLVNTVSEHVNASSTGQEHLLNTESNRHRDGEEDGDFGTPIEVEHREVKKKKKRSARSKRGLGKPTGFEEYHADAPITPEEAKEDEELYDPDLPFINRVLTAIQRFERTRKLSSERRDIFYKYLAYGGLTVSPNMFQSVSTIDTENMTKTQLATAMSQVSMGNDKYNLNSPNALYAVDFEACAKSFLSRHIWAIAPIDTREDAHLVTSTLERFMDYLLQHDVCPEYTTDVLRTRDFCRRAADELYSCAQLARLIPKHASFNIACSTLFAGHYSKFYDGETYLGPEDDSPDSYHFVGMTQDEATRVIKFGVAGAATESVYQYYTKLLNSNNPDDKFEVVDKKPQAGFEITKIYQATKDCVKLYKSQTNDWRAVGRVLARPWHDPQSPPEDFTPSASPSLQPTTSTSSTARSVPTPPNQPTEESEEYTFLLESHLLAHLRPGTKLVATIHKLNCGIHWFEEFLCAYPSFDVWLCNELMVGWKEPRWIEGSLEWERERSWEEEERAKAEELEKLQELKLDDHDNNHNNDNKEDDAAVAERGAMEKDPMDAQSAES